MLIQLEGFFRFFFRYLLNNDAALNKDVLTNRIISFNNNAFPFLCSVINNSPAGRKRHDFPGDHETHLFHPDAYELDISAGDYYGHTFAFWAFNHEIIMAAFKNGWMTGKSTVTHHLRGDLFPINFPGDTCPEGSDKLFAGDMGKFPDFEKN